MVYLTLFFVSVVANFFSALAGGGAGLIQFPALIFMGLPFGTALATHKVASVALGMGATARHARASHLNARFCLLILGAGLPGVILGARVILNVSDSWAQITLGILTIGLGLYSLLKPALGQHDSIKHRNPLGILMGATVIFLIGVLNGSLTSGTGLFLTLWLIHWFGFDYKRAVAYTLILVGLAWNFTGALTLGIIGEIHWQWIPALFTGSLVGGYLGAHVSIENGNQLIKRAFELMTIVVGLSLILKVIWSLLNF